MNHVTWNDRRLSRLILGTVQFGLPYGVANRTGQPSYRESLAIVKAALDGGVDCFDTAAGYGTSEVVLGRIFQELGVTDGVTVVTKVQALKTEELENSELALRAIEESVAQSRRRLRIDCLPVVLFHREADAVHMDLLTALRDRGWLQHCGISCDSLPGPATEFVTEQNVSALQLPASLLDPRHLRSGVLDAAGQRNVAIFIRSVYLQGLLVMPEDDIPPALRDLIPVRRRLDGIAAGAGISTAELSLRSVLSSGGVTGVLVGVETVSQMKDNLAMFDRGPLEEGILTAITTAVPELPEALITPRLWPVQKA
ncbi:MAG: aldo/keto reductase [Planctomycetaceae bacterium]